MRVGTNPLKHRAVLAPYKRHRIIMAVYIPNEQGYYRDALTIFRLCLTSLISTVDSEHVSITVIDNASIPEVGSLLADAVASGHVDRRVRNAVNRGKPDAVIAEIKASYEPYITIVDSDVLFLPGWLQAVEAVYRTWPEAAAVSPASQPRLAFYQNASTWLFAVTRMAVRLRKYVPDADLHQLAHSVGNDALHGEHEIAAQYALTRNGGTALIGAGHFVITLRRSCYEHFAYMPRLEGTGHGMRQLDLQVDRHGGLRLSTTRAYVLHMGNTVEEWMHERLVEVGDSTPVQLAPHGDEPLDRPWRSRRALPYWARRWLAKPLTVLAYAYYKKSRGTRGKVTSKESLQ